ncbi:MULTISPECIES: DUF6611 family protein [unclassified Microbacterium]|uniref:DUF6611 family protein n=1 Tax=unclassified Microbacterium TaxID=2609290 RepID=UPI0021A49E96|nr:MULTISPECIES: DUF6611 family protein [unclassified Microbacterium]MCT1364098.1 hypothetical protein [Microbacterium sp. p3-SID131]MCT1375260.1 hypothetical protein [Microbacterium sp. p3-SID337]
MSSHKSAFETGDELRPLRPRRVRWGYVYQSFARYGVVTTRIVVFSPVSSESERFWADSLRIFTPVAVAVATASWFILVSLGLAPEVSAFLLAVVVLGLGGWLWWKSRVLRGRVATAWASRTGLWTSSVEQAREEAISDLAELIQLASDRYRRGEIDESVFQRVWLAVYEETLAFDLPSRPAH